MPEKMSKVINIIGIRVTKTGVAGDATARPKPAKIRGQHHVRRGCSALERPLNDNQEDRSKLPCSEHAMPATQQPHGQK